MTPDHEAADVAKRLTKAQQYLVLILSGNWASRALAERVIFLPVDLLEIAAPLRTGHERVRLTPLGLRVRAVLQGEGK